VAESPKSTAPAWNASHKISLDESPSQRFTRSDKFDGPLQKHAEFLPSTVTWPHVKPLAALHAHAPHCAGATGARRCAVRTVVVPAAQAGAFAAAPS